MAPRPNVALRMPPPEMHSALKDGDAPWDWRRLASSRMTSLASRGVFAWSMRSSGITGPGGRTGAVILTRFAKRLGADSAGSGRRHLLLDLRERVEDDVADNLQAARADVLEVDDVDRLHAGLDERQVIVLHGEVLGNERRSVAEASGRAPDDRVQPARGVGVGADVEVAVPDHVEQDERLQAGEAAVLLRRADVVLAAVGVVRIAPLGVDRLFAVEEEQLDRVLVLAVLEHAGELQHGRRGGGRVARAEEPELLETLGVVVGGQRDAVGAPAGDGADDVDHRDDAGGRHRVERLLAIGDADRLELRLDVLAALREGGRPCGPRAERHLALEIRPRAIAVEPRARSGGSRPVLRVGAAGNKHHRHRRKQSLLHLNPFYL